LRPYKVLPFHVSGSSHAGIRRKQTISPLLALPEVEARQNAQPTKLGSSMENMDEVKSSQRVVTVPPYS
jgi:hypothetical protein